MKPHPTRQSAFTLIETVIAAAILVIAITTAMRGFMYAIRSSRQSNIQDELDIDVQTAMERIKYDLRLSSLNKMFFFPAGAGPFSGISFPMARDDDGDGAVDLAADGTVIWDRTLIYHVWSGEPNQLRLTAFDPRDTSLSDAQRQTQLDQVVAAGGGGSTYNSANASTAVVFENLFDWEIVPNGSIYDGYASDVTRDIDVVLGSCVISNGPHEFKFEVLDNNDNSSGYGIGLDSLFVSPSYGTREAEAQLPVTDRLGSLPFAQYMPGGSWDGNYQLYFAASDIGQYFTLTMNNDRWEETNFGGTGFTTEDTKRVFDTSGYPYDFVVCLDGPGTNWTAEAQTGDTNGVPPSSDNFADTVVRVILRGEEMENGAWFQFNGGKCSVNFKAGTLSSEKLRVATAYIAECASTESNTMDAATGTSHQLTFGGASDITIDGGNSAWSDWADFPIDKNKSYLISFYVANGIGLGNPWGWRETNAPTETGAYLIPSPAGLGASLAATEVWTTQPSVIATNVLLGVQCLKTTYPTNGTYTSRIFDTQMADPNYTAIDWNSSVPSGTTLSMKLRTGNSNDMSDAASWTNIAPMVAPAPINPGANRYVQFQTRMTPNSAGTETPKLKDVTITWPGPERLVDIGGTFTTGPSYGIFQLTVDGDPLKTGITIDLEIFKDALGHKGTRRVTSALTAEVTPRNSGR